MLAVIFGGLPNFSFADSIAADTSPVSLNGTSQLPDQNRQATPTANLQTATADAVPASSSQEGGQPTTGTTDGSPAGASSKRSAVKTVAHDFTQLLERNFGMPGYSAPDSVPLPRRAPPPALDSVFPSSEFLGTDGQAPMGVNDNNYAQYPLEQYLWSKCPVLRENRIRIYGWINPSFNVSTSRNSNFPLSYAVPPTKCIWTKLCYVSNAYLTRCNRNTPDWGFRLTSMYGEDYRFTTAKGWFSSQLLKDNNLTGSGSMRSLHRALSSPVVWQEII